MGLVASIVVLLLFLFLLLLLLFVVVVVVVVFGEGRGTSSLILLVQKYTPEIEPRKKKTKHYWWCITYVCQRGQAKLSLMH